LPTPFLKFLYDLIRLHHEEVIPYRCHIRSNTVLNAGKRAMAMLHVQGLPFELEPGAQRRARMSIRNTVLRQIADSAIELGFHMVHHRHATPPPQPVSNNPFVRSLMRSWEQTALKDLFTNDWFATITLDPPNTLKRSLLKFFPLPGRKTEILDLTPPHHRRLEEITTQLSSTLKDYNLTRLTVDEIPTELDDTKVPITHIGSALRLIRTAHYQPVPLTWGSLGAAIYDEEVNIHPRYFHTGIGEEPYGAILCLHDYPVVVHNGMLNSLMATPYPVVVSHTFRYHSVSLLSAMYTIMVRQMKAAGSFASKVMKKAEDAIGEAEGSENAPGRHHIQIAVYARSPEELESIVADAKTRLSQQGGATVKREYNRWSDGALETQYYAQLPATTHMKPAPADISTEDIAAMATFDNYPPGERFSRWGPSPIRLRSRAGTAWDLPTHDEDVGHFMVFGPNGRGKTVWGGLYMSALEPLMGENGIRLTIDKDDSNRLWIEAQGGRHQRLRRNQPSGLAPLTAYDLSPESVSFVFGLLKSKILSDKRGPITTLEDKRLIRGITRQFKIFPREKRSIGGVREEMGFANGDMGAGNRLERYCRGCPEGWLLDNEEQLIHVGPGLQGYDFGDLLPREGQVDDGAAETAAAVIWYELRQLMDGRRIAFLGDEVKFYIKVLEFLLEDAALTGRKKEMIVGLMFQQPEHVLESVIGTALVAQMRRKYVFPDPNYKIQHLRGIGLSAAAIKLVMGDMMLGNARKMLVWDKTPFIADIDMTGMQHLDILSARPQNVILFDQLKAAMPDAEPAEIEKTFLRTLAERQAA
jgi:type IV secretion system protein VirB4